MHRFCSAADKFHRRRYGSGAAVETCGDPVQSRRPL